MKHFMSDKKRQQKDPAFSDLSSEILQQEIKNRAAGYIPFVCWVLLLLNRQK